MSTDSSTSVTMQPPSGQTVQTMHLAGGVTVQADGSGHFSIPSNYVAQLLAWGWSIVVSSGTTHVP